MVMGLTKKTGWKTTCAVSLLLGIAAGGCSLGGDDAQAAGEKRIETVAMTAGSLVLLTDAPPTIQIQEGTTTYTLVSAASLTFTSSGSPQSFALEANDVVIERPAAGVVTVFRSQ